uniref:Uncharacterized protein n=1 Tax=Eutreptiella gymnastica TaxID=73025 RepID=A0A7S1NBJ9_9EUGL
MPYTSMYAPQSLDVVVEDPIPRTHALHQGVLPLLVGLVVGAATIFVTIHGPPKATTHVLLPSLGTMPHPTPYKASTSLFPRPQTPLRTFLGPTPSVPTPTSAMSALHAQSGEGGINGGEYLEIGPEDLLQDPIIDVWGSPNWNWGYAQGEAHDRAAVMRAELGDTSDRLAFLATLLSGKVQWNDISLCLGLQFQRAGHERRDGAPTGYNLILNRLVANKYEGEGGVGKLTHEMTMILYKMMPPFQLKENEKIVELLPQGHKPPDLLNRRIVALVLLSMDFVNAGL